MSDCENPPETETDNVALSNGNCENASKSSEQMGLMELSARRQKCKWRTNFIFLVLLIASNSATAVICVFVTKSGPPTNPSSCPSGWDKHEGKCYYFSQAENTWKSSQSYCSEYGASLLPVEDQKEKNFIMNTKNHTEYWIGLWRAKNDQPWKWTNGADFNN